MRSNRRRNWLIKRIALGLSVAAFAAPVAQAKVDEGASFGSKTTVNAADYGMPRAMPSDYALATGDQIRVVRADPPGETSNDIVAADYGMPRAMPSDYALATHNQIRVVRADPPGETLSDIGGEAQVVSTGFNWGDAVTGGGFALLLVLLGGASAAVASRHLGKQQTA